MAADTTDLQRFVKEARRGADHEVATLRAALGEAMRLLGIKEPAPDVVGLIQRARLALSDALAAAEDADLAATSRDEISNVLETVSGLVIDVDLALRGEP